MNRVTRGAMLALIVLLALLSIAAGVPKAMQVARELDFLAALGLPPAGVTALGFVQIAGGALLPWARTRIVGALLAAVGFAVSSAALFAGGDTAFALVSLVPVVLLLVAVGVLRTPSGGEAAN